MTRPRLFGADYSVYVRIARLALTEKGVDYELVPVDIFAAGGPPAGYLERQPFGKIPAFEHGDFRLFEPARSHVTSTRRSPARRCSRPICATAP